MSMEVQLPPEYQAAPTAANEHSAAPGPSASPTTTKAVRRRRFRAAELILLCVLVVDAFLALDFVFRATAVTQDGFVTIVDRVGNALANPFAGLLRTGVGRVGHTTFWAALLALAVYTIAALILVRIMHLLSSPFRHTVSPG